MTREPTDRQSKAFWISRTSGPWGEAGPPPIPGCVLEPKPRYDTRTFKSFEEHDEHLREPWLSRGTEHEVLRGPRGGAIGIRRRIEDREGWTITADSLGALLDLVKAHGEIIVSYEPKVGYSLEIYDGYRE